LTTLAPAFPNLAGDAVGSTQEIQIMSIAKRNEGAKVNSDINVTPMVDVMLVLLIIFMVITPMLQKGVSVDYGEGQQSRRRCRMRTRKML
jgi:biopolymer transport protein ExbD